MSALIMNTHTHQFRALFFLLAILITTNGYGDQQDTTASNPTTQNLDSIINKYKPLKCGKSKSPLFKVQP